MCTAARRMGVVAPAVLGAILAAAGAHAQVRGRLQLVR